MTVKEFINRIEMRLNPDAEINFLLLKPKHWYQLSLYSLNMNVNADRLESQDNGTICFVINSTGDSLIESE